ncbi:MAG: heavy-metal-associated domain-containing protein [Saprospiraceae bacterium]
MKYLSLIFSFVLFAGLQLQAQDATVKTETFKVYGNCGSCEKRIEKAANGVRGVQSADWDKETDMITVRFDAATADLVTIKKAIAASGYDTEEFRAPEEAYNSLPGCCQYDRPAAPDAVESTTDVQTTEATFTVYGNCGMCKRRIEGALKEVPGVYGAVWEKGTKKLTVNYDEATITLDDIQKRVAAVGHDTDKFRADDKVYDNLPGCCLYDRPKS